MTKTRALLPVLLLAMFVAASCSSSDASTDTTSDTPGESQSEPAAEGIRLISPTEGAALQSSPPDDLVILDVRTPEEFADGHVEGAIMLDFYEADFADRLSELDPDAPYLVYCRSGNRSGQTTAIMAELGFTDVADVDGGIVAWNEAGLEVVGG